MHWRCHHPLSVHRYMWEFAGICLFVWAVMPVMLGANQSSQAALLILLADSPFLRCATAARELFYKPSSSSLQSGDAVLGMVKHVATAQSIRNLSLWLGHAVHSSSSAV